MRIRKVVISRFSLFLALIMMICGFLSQVQYGCASIKNQNKCFMHQSNSSILDNSEYIFISQKTINYCSRSIDIFGQVDSKDSSGILLLIWQFCIMFFFFVIIRHLYIIIYIHKSDGRKKTGFCLT